MERARDRGEALSDPRPGTVDKRSWERHDTGERAARNAAASEARPRRAHSARLVDLEDDLRTKSRHSARAKRLGVRGGGDVRPSCSAHEVGDERVLGRRREEALVDEHAHRGELGHPCLGVREPAAQGGDEVPRPRRCADEKAELERCPLDLVDGSVRLNVERRGAPARGQGDVDRIEGRRREDEVGLEGDDGLDVDPPAGTDDRLRPSGRDAGRDADQAVLRAEPSDELCSPRAESDDPLRALAQDGRALTFSGDRHRVGRELASNGLGTLAAAGRDECRDEDEHRGSHAHAVSIGARGSRAGANAREEARDVVENSTLMESEWWQRAAVAGAMVVLALVVARLADRALARRLRLPPEALTRYRVLRRSLTAIIVTLGLLSALLVIPEVRAVAGGVLASSAVVGLVVGLSARSTLANFVAGVLIAFTQPLRLGDEIEVGEAAGTVEEIALTYTTIVASSGERFFIPNEKLASDTIRNSTIASSGHLVQVRVPVPLAADLDRVLSLLEEEARAAVEPRGEKEPVASVTDFETEGPSAIVTVQAWSPVGGAEEVERGIRRAVHRRLRAEGIFGAAA